MLPLTTSLEFLVNTMHQNFEGVGWEVVRFLQHLNQDFIGFFMDYGMLLA